MCGRGEPSALRWPHSKRAGAGERDGVGCADGAPAFLGGLDQLEGYGGPAASEPGPLVTLARCLSMAKVSPRGLGLP
jgi:hypothetical protein